MTPTLVATILTAMAVMTFMFGYMHRPRCPNCNSIRSRKQEHVPSDRLYVCRSCNTVYEVFRGHH